MLLAAGVLVVASSTSCAAGSALKIKVYKDPYCSCCTAWVDHLKRSGFEVDVEERDDLDSIKAKHGVPDDLTSCHTGVIDGYVIEGHVPAADIKRLVASHSPAKGLAVPGMPVNSPGMEIPGESNEPYTVWLFQKGGKREVFARHGI